MLLQLADKLQKTKGKKVYGYLKPEVKAIVDAIMIRLSENEQITKLYDLWYQQKENAIKIYSDELPQRIPLVDNKEFKPLKNAIIQEAMKISQHRYGGETADTGDEGQEVHREPDEEIHLPIPQNDNEYILFSEDDEVPAEENEQDEDEEQPQENTPAPMSEKNPNKTWWTERYKLARFYLYGDKEHDPDFEKAIELLKTESANGNGFAIYDLGKMYLSGLGCNKDEIAAQEYFRKAYFAFINQLAKTKKPAYLQYRIGKLYALGYGVEQDDTQAALWYQKSVDAQNPFAAYALAGLYFKGQGVAQDDSRAFELYQMAATDKNKPNAYAQYELGRMCRDGIGTSVDTGASDYWFRKAYQGFLKIEKDLADDKLYYRLGQMNLKGVGTEIDLQKAREYFEKAIKLGNDNAMLALGKMYIYGNGVPEDFNIGVDYLKMSAAQGNAYAAQLLEKLENDRNYFAAIGSLRLLQYLGRMLQNRIDDRKIEAEGKTDRKLYRKIQEKKQAQGLK